jgi:predicted RND superfamily exporter protein
MKQLRSLGFKLGLLQAKHPYFFVMLAVLITIVTVPGIPILLSNVEPSLEKILPAQLEEIRLMNDMRSQFGADMFFIVITSDSTSVLSQDILQYIDSLSSTIRQQEYVVQTQSVADLLKQQVGTIPTDTAITTQLVKSMAYPFVSDDQTTTYIQVQTDTGASAQTVGQVMNDLKTSIAFTQGFNPGVDVSVTGFSAIDNATFSVILSDFAKITLVSFGLMVIFLLIHYRFSVKKTIYSLVIMIFSLIWALGVTGYIGIELNVVTMVAAAMIMALGSSYGINSVYHFYDDFLLQYPKSLAIPKFQEFLIVGLSGSALAEIAGFLALLFGIMPSMSDLGIILAIGISFSLIVSVCILPAFFYLLESDTQSDKAGVI